MPNSAAFLRALGPGVGRYENEHALTRDEVELYGLWLESHARYDEALGLYNLHEAHLPNERLLAGLASLRDPTMMITTQDTQSLPTVRHASPTCCRHCQNFVVV